MARLTYQERKRMPKKKFAFPSKKTKANPAGRGGYPLDTRNRAQNALSRGKRWLSPKKYNLLEMMVHRSYPGMKIKGLSARSR